MELGSGPAPCTPATPVDAPAAQGPMEEPAGLAAQDGEALAALETEGFAVLRAALRPQACAELLACLRRRRAQVDRLVAAGVLDDAYAYGNVRCREQRADLRLLLEDAAAALRDVLARCDEVVEEFFGCRDAQLIELSSLHALPGCAEQPRHADTPGAFRAVLTVFVALQDIDRRMGPTQLWPRSQRRSGGVALGPDEAAEGCSRTEALLQQGDALLMDSRLIHCGGSNVSSEDRVLFYHSWALPGAALSRSWRWPQGGSLLPEYEQRFRFASWDQWTAPPAAAPCSALAEAFAADEGELRSFGD